MNKKQLKEKIDYEEWEVRVLREEIEKRQALLDKKREYVEGLHKEYDDYCDDDFENVADVPAWVNKKIYDTREMRYYPNVEFGQMVTGKWFDDGDGYTTLQDAFTGVTKTQDEAERLGDYLIARREYINAIKVFNKYYNWKVDWTEQSQKKYYFYLDHSTNTGDCMHCGVCQELPTSEHFSENVFNNTKMFNYLKQKYLNMLLYEDRLNNSMNDF